MSNDLVYRLRKRAEIRRQIQTRKSVQEGKPDRISDLLEEAATRIDDLEQALANHPPLAPCAPGVHGPEPMEPCEPCSWSEYVRNLFGAGFRKLAPSPEPEEHQEDCLGSHCRRCGSCDGGSCICYAR